MRRVLTKNMMKKKKVKGKKNGEKDFAQTNKRELRKKNIADILKCKIQIKFLANRNAQLRG